MYIKKLILPIKINLVKERMSILNAISIAIQGIPLEITEKEANIIKVKLIFKK